MTNVCIVIPVHNRKVYTQTILAQIHEQLEQLHQLNHLDQAATLFTILVDDGSTDGTKELVQDQFPAVHILQGDGSLWWTGAIARGMEYAMTHLNADYVVWLNDDISLSETFISTLLNLCHSSQYKDTVVGGIVRDTTYLDWVVYSGISNGKPIRHISCFDSASELKAGTLSGNIVVIPKAVIDKVGLPNVERFTHHGGDFEYIRMVKKNGFKVFSSSQLQAFTDYKPADLIRYMPYWMQWYLRRSRDERQAIVKGLRTLKSNQNVWLFVNIKNCDRDYIPQWKYDLCYLDKRLKLFVIDFIPRSYLNRKVVDYLNTWNAPTEIVEAAMNPIA